MKTEEYIKEVCDLINCKLEYLQNSEIADGIEEKKLSRKDKERQKLLDFVQQILSRSTDIKELSFLDENGEYATQYPIVSDDFIDYISDKIVGKKWMTTSEKFADVVKRRKWYELSKKKITKASASAYKKKFEETLIP